MLTESEEEQAQSHEDGEGRRPALNVVIRLHRVGQLVVELHIGPLNAVHYLIQVREVVQSEQEGRREMSSRQEIQSIVVPEVVGMKREVGIRKLLMRVDEVLFRERLRHLLQLNPVEVLFEYPVLVGVVLIIRINYYVLPSVQRLPVPCQRFHLVGPTRVAKES